MTQASAVADVLAGEVGAERSTNGTAAAAGARSTWAPVDLAAVLAGGEQVEQPTILRREDGEAIFYPRRLHSLIGEPEGGKGWIGSAASAEQLQAGEDVLWIDFEDEAREQVARLLALGVEAEAIVDRLHYVRPEDPLGPDSWTAFASATSRRPTLVIVNGITGAMTLNGLNPLDNSDVAKWHRFTRQLVAATGGAVVEVDHVVKDKEQRGRYALGAQHKLAGVDVALVVKRRQEFGRGRVGEVDLLVKKDRPGFLRQFAEGEKVASIRLISEPDEEAAEYLRCKPKRVYDLLSQHRLPRVKDGSRVLIRREDLDAYLEGDRG